MKVDYSTWCGWRNVDDVRESNAFLGDECRIIRYIVGHRGGSLRVVWTIGGQHNSLIGREDLETHNNTLEADLLLFLFLLQFNLKELLRLERIHSPVFRLASTTDARTKFPTKR